MYILILIRKVINKVENNFSTQNISSLPNTKVKSSDNVPIEKQMMFELCVGGESCISITSVTKEISWQFIERIKYHYGKNWNSSSLKHVCSGHVQILEIDFKAIEKCYGTIACNKKTAEAILIK